MQLQYLLKTPMAHRFKISLLVELREITRCTSLRKCIHNDGNVFFTCTHVDCLTPLSCTEVITAHSARSFAPPSSSFVAYIRCCQVLHTSSFPNHLQVCARQRDSGTVPAALDVLQKLMYLMLVLGICEHPLDFLFPQGMVTPRALHAHAAFSAGEKSSMT